MTPAASADTQQRPASEMPAADRLCRCDKPLLRTQARGKWAISSECATCGGLAPLKLR
ncbi:MAG: hypothetical protein QOF45_2709 [Gaiellaceae bacterium]|jgi:hypothetical protein|nr:hypothetical protein [Gaiellaceae bacterium]